MSRKKKRLQRKGRRFHSTAPPRFAVGTSVRVKHGVTDPDFPDIPLGGWAGHVTELDRQGPTCVPDPACWRHFDGPPDARIPPALLEEVAARIGRARRPRRNLTWRQVKLRVRLAREGVDPEALAIGLLVKHPDWGVARIAAAVGVHRGTLHRWPTFQALQARVLAAAAAEFRAEVPRGQKRPAGGDGAGGPDLEAWAEEGPADEDE